MNNPNGLILTLELPSEPAHLNRPMTIKTTLTNEGEKAVLINKRLAPGYEQTISRELFADFTQVENGEKAPYYEVDINRDFSPKEDYVYLNPGESISTSFNLFEFYQVTKPGKYNLALYYQADEPLATAPAGVVQGRLASNTATLEVLQGVLPGSD